MHTPFAIAQMGIGAKATNILKLNLKLRVSERSTGRKPVLAGIICIPIIDLNLPPRTARTRGVVRE